MPAAWAMAIVEVMDFLMVPLSVSSDPATSIYGSLSDYGLSFLTGFLSVELTCS